MRLLKAQNFIFGLWLGLLGCANLDDNVSTNGNVQLFFSTDTVLFDTLITGRNSITRRFRAFNQSKENIEISSISVGTGDQSSYSLIVNGKEGKSIENEVLNGEDSILVLISAFIDEQDESMPFLVKDSVVFRWNGNQADVKLVAYGQDANFLGNEIICDETWSMGKPYVITEPILIDSLCTLTLEAGTKVYIDNGAVIDVKGQLLVRGDTGTLNVVFRNTRFDDAFVEAPGQWGGIRFFPGSSGNEIQFATIENAVNGIFTFGTNSEEARVEISIENTTIRHMSGSGVQAFTSNISMTNSLIYNCSSFLFSGFVGGSYSIDHCTFSNQPNFFVRDEPSFVAVDNFSGDPSLVENLDLTLTNSIIWGSEQEEFFIRNEGGASLDTNIFQNIIKSVEEIPGNLTSTDFNFPGFNDPFAFDYSLDTLSNAKDAATGSVLEIDINGIMRDDLPDIGAFERIEN